MFGWGRGALVKRTEDESSEYGRVKKQTLLQIFSALLALLIALGNILMWGPGTMVAAAMSVVLYVGLWFTYRGLLVANRRPERKEEILAWLFRLGVVLAILLGLLGWKGLWAARMVWPISTPHFHAFWKVCITAASGVTIYGLYLQWWRMSVEVVDPGHTSRHEQVKSRTSPYWPWALSPKVKSQEVEYVVTEGGTPITIDGEKKPELPTPQKCGPRGQAQYFRAVLGHSAKLSRKEAMRFDWARADWDAFVDWVDGNVVEVPKGKPIPSSARLKRLMSQVVGHYYRDESPQLESGKE